MTTETEVFKISVKNFRNFTEFLSEWPKRIRNLFRDKYGYKWDRMLNGNHPKYFDREIRFTRPTPPPVPPVSAGSFLNL